MRAQHLLNATTGDWSCSKRLLFYFHDEFTSPYDRRVDVYVYRELLMHALCSDEETPIV